MPPLPDTAVCLHCGYSLRGLPENVCPECGRGFAPDDGATWRDKTVLSWPGRLWYSLIAAPSRVHVYLTAILTIIFLAALSSPTWAFDGRESISAALALMGLTPLALAYAIKAVGRGVEWLMVESEWVSRRPKRTGSWRWMVLPICIALVGVSFTEPQWPFAVRFAVSRPFLEIKAQRVRREGKPDNHSRMIGLIYVERVGLLAHGRVKFEVGWCWAGSLALMHDPIPVGQVGSPANHWTGHHEQVAKGWYWYTW